MSTWAAISRNRHDCYKH